MAIYMKIVCMRSRRPRAIVCCVCVHKTCLVLVISGSSEGILFVLLPSLCLCTVLGVHHMKLVPDVVSLSAARPVRSCV